MSHLISGTAHPVEGPLLGPNDPPAVTVKNPDGKARCVLVCEHGGVAVPEKLGDLGLEASHFTKHYALDIGVRRVTETLSDILDAPAVFANYSRLVIDLNRNPQHPTAFVTSGEGHPVPGNIGLSAEDKAQRVDELYTPYHTALKDTIDRRVDAGILPAVIAIHSFTPVFFNQKRPWEIGMLWVQDKRLPDPMMDWFRERDFVVGDNEPYDARVMRGTTVNIHGDDRRLANALVEIRHDLIANDPDCDHWAKLLGDCLQTVLARSDLGGYYDGPLHEHDPELEHRYFDNLVEKARQADKAEK